MIDFLNKILIRFGYKLFSLKEYEDILSYYNDVNSLAQLEYIDSLNKKYDKSI